MPTEERPGRDRGESRVTLWPDDLWPVVVVDRSAKPFRSWMPADVIDARVMPDALVERYEEALADLLEARDALVAEWRRRGGTWWPERGS